MKAGSSVANPGCRRSRSRDGTSTIATRRAASRIRSANGQRRGRAARVLVRRPSHTSGSHALVGRAGGRTTCPVDRLRKAQPGALVAEPRVQTMGVLPMCAGFHRCPPGASGGGRLHCPVRRVVTHTQEEGRDRVTLEWSRAPRTPATGPPSPGGQGIGDARGGEGAVRGPEPSPCRRTGRSPVKNSP